MKKWRHVVFFVFVFACMAVLVMMLWNAILPAVCGWSKITYVQAVGLMVLTRLLFGGMGHPFGFGFHRRANERFHARLGDMSREEKRNFIRQRLTDLTE